MIADPSARGSVEGAVVVAMAVARKGLAGPVGSRQALKAAGVNKARGLQVVSASAQGDRRRDPATDAS